MSDYGPAEKIKADDIAAVFRSEIRADVEALKAQGVHPTLVGFLGTGDVSAKKYSEWTMKACEADGIKFEVREVLALSSARLHVRDCAYTEGSTAGWHASCASSPLFPFFVLMADCAYTALQVDKMDLEEALAAASQDPNVHGILIYYPCFGAAPSFYGNLPAPTNLLEP